MKRNEPLIVCGTDFSLPAAEAAKVAADLARLMNGKLLLLHAAEHPGVISEPPQIGQAFVSAQGAELHAAAETLRASGSKVEEAFAFGPADKALVETAAERQARLIVVGAVGRTRRLLTGSVAVRTAESAAVPTLVVRQPGLFTPWIENARKLRITIADDFSATSEAALRFVASLAELAPCEITVVHLDWPPEERQRYGIRGRISLTENDPEVQRALEEKLNERTRAAFGDHACHSRVMPCWGRAEGHILNLAETADADLIVLGTHQRRGMERFRLGSVSRAVLHDAPVSVLTVPIQKVAALRKLHAKQQVAMIA